MITLLCDGGRCHRSNISVSRRRRKGARGSGQSLLVEHPPIDPQSRLFSDTRASDGGFQSAVDRSESLGKNFVLRVRLY